MWTVVLISALFGFPPEAQIAESVADSAARELLVESVEGVLLADKDLAVHHSGYVSFLMDRPDWDAVETAYIAMQQSARLHPLLGDFEDALAERPRSEHAYLSFRQAQEDQPNLRTAVDALEDSGMQWTMERLEGVIGGAQSTEFDPVAQFQSVLGPDAAKAAQELSSDPAARRLLEPWWRIQYDVSDRGAGRAYVYLTTALRETPGGLAAWRNRESMMIRDAKSAAWIQYWHGRVRETPDLGARYYEYLAALQENPELADARAQEFRRVAGGRSWPPAGSPPKVSLPSAAAIRGDVSRRRGAEVERNSRPTRVNRPARPVRPIRGGQVRSTTDYRRPDPPRRPAPPELERERDTRSP